MADDAALREHLLTLFRGNVGRRFEGAVKDFPVEFMNVNPPNVDYTPWGLLEHLQFSIRDIIGYIRDPNYKNPSHPVDYWPKEGDVATPEKWKASVERYREGVKVLEDMIQDPNVDLFAPMPHTPGHTLFREVGLQIGHGSYHIGEFGILRQVMQTWPPEHYQSQR